MRILYKYSDILRECFYEKMQELGCDYCCIADVSLRNQYSACKFAGIDISC